MALVGIARLAAQSELLEAKRRSAIFRDPGAQHPQPHQAQHAVPVDHQSLPGLRVRLQVLLSRATPTNSWSWTPPNSRTRSTPSRPPPTCCGRNWAASAARERIALGTATDPYQPAERRFGRTRAILEVFARERGRHLSITTKSDLVTRDVELLREIARANVLAVNLTITTLDEKLARLLEPRAPRPELRLEAVRKLSHAGIAVCVFANPVMPLLTDGERELDRLARAARDAGAQAFSGGPLFLMPSAQKIFLPFLERHFPRLAPRYRRHYARGAYVGPAYREILRARVAKIRERHGLAAAPVEYRPELWEPDPQGLLFPLDRSYPRMPPSSAAGTRSPMKNCPNSA